MLTRYDRYDDQAGLPLVLARPRDLTADQKKLCDDLITLLGNYNLSEDKPNDTTRDRLWKEVFRRGWTTDCVIKEPKKKIRDHQAYATR